MIKIKHVTPAILGLLGVFSTNAHAATGTIGVYANRAFLIEQRTSNITGPVRVPLGQVGTYTATFPNLSNSSGSFTAVLGSNGPDITCTTAFVSTVVNGVCHVAVTNTPTGGATCSAGGVVVNASTCDFTVNVDDSAN